MLFQHTFEKVILDEKTQTRRLVKPRQYARRDEDLPRAVAPIVQVAQADKDGFTGVFARVIYNVGSVYSVQPGRGRSGLWWRATANGAEVYDGVSFTTFSPEVRRSRDNQPNLSKDWLLANGFQPARIRLGEIRREDVRGIGEADAQAEGFANRLEFFEVWCGMHDKPSLTKHTELTAPSVFDISRSWSERYRMQYLNDWIEIALPDRPAERYDAWVLRFELLKE